MVRNAALSPLIKLALVVFVVRVVWTIVIAMFLRMISIIDTLS